MRIQLDRRAMALGALLLLCRAGPALADAIDGEWCNDTGRHFTIQGPAITTPAGTAITGTYNRHAFSYVTPPSEPSAGTPVFMRLLNERTVNLRRGADPSAPIEVWTRCNPVS